MKAPTVSTVVWARWLRLEMFGDPELEQLCRYTGRFVQAMKERKKPRWLSLLGKSGTGKTHVAQRIWDSCWRRFDWSRVGYNDRIVYWPEFVEEMRDSVRQGLGTPMLLDMGKWPLLVIDDIGAELDRTGFASEKLNTLLGMRVGKWTVLTSNLNLEGLSRIDDRIASRIIREPGNLFIEMTTKDYGLRKGQPQ